MNKTFMKDMFGWGFLVWLFGYILGIVFFMIMPADLIGWIITPIAIVVTLFVLFRKIASEQFQYYVVISLVWTSMAVVLDYFLIVALFHPSDGYYKPDVYLYYILTFLLPMIVGGYKQYKAAERRLNRK